MNTTLASINANTEDYYSGRVKYHNGEWKWAKYCLGFGQKGYYGTETFLTLEEATEAYNKMVKEIEASFNRTNGFTREDIPATEGSRIVYYVKYTSKLKNGKKGKIVHTISLTTMGK